MRSVSVRLIGRCKIIENSRWTALIPKSCSNYSNYGVYSLRSFSSVISNSEIAIPLRRPTPSGSENSTMFAEEDGLDLLKAAYDNNDMDMFFSGMKTFASTNYRKNINSELIGFFRDENGKIPSKVLNHLDSSNIGNILWSLSKVHSRRAKADPDMVAIGLQFLAILSRMNGITPRPLSTSLLALADLGLSWADMPENDRLYISFTLLKNVLNLDATGSANVFVALSKFQRKWMDIDAELQQALLLRLTHKSKHAYTNGAYTMNCTHFSTVLYHMGLMDFKYNEAHPRVQALIEEMMCRVIGTVSAEKNLRHTEQALKTGLIGLATVGAEFHQLKAITQTNIASIAAMDMSGVSPLTFSSILETFGKLKLHWSCLSPEQQSSLSSLVVHHLPYMLPRELAVTVLALGRMEAAQGLNETTLEPVMHSVRKHIKVFTQQDVVNLIAGYGRLGIDFAKLESAVQHQLGYKFMVLQKDMTTGQLAMCLRGFAAMHIRVNRDVNISLHKTMVAAFLRVLRESQCGTEIANAVFGFGHVDYHRLHLLPMSVITEVEKALLEHLKKMNDNALTNTLMGLSAMNTEFKMLKPELVLLIQTTLSERSNMPTEQRHESEQAIYMMMEVNKTTRKSNFHKNPPASRAAVELLNDIDHDCDNLIDDNLKI